MKPWVIGVVAAFAWAMAHGRAGAAQLDAKVVLKLENKECVSKLESFPPAVKSRNDDTVRWILKNTCGGTEKVKFAVTGAPQLFKQCSDSAGQGVHLTAAPIPVANTVLLVCPVDYVAVLGPRPHNDQTPKKGVRVLIRDVARNAPRECEGLPPADDGTPATKALREAWLRKCRSAELALEVVP